MSAMTILTSDLIMHEKLDYTDISNLFFCFFSLDFRDNTEGMEINCKNKSNLMPNAEWRTERARIYISHWFWHTDLNR